MAANKITCALCNYQYEEGEKPACHQCPLHAGCDLICCPNCGYSTVHPEESSKLISWLKRLFGKNNPPLDPELSNLRSCKCGDCVVVKQFSENIPARKKAFLVSCGIRPGKQVVVLQQKPATIIQVDNMEFALEHEICENILIENEDSDFIQIEEG